MNKRDKVRPKHEKPRGVLHTSASRPVSGLRRYWPSSELLPFVEHYWIVTWDLPEAQLAETIPHPSVHVVLEAGRAEVVGVMRSRFSRLLERQGRVIGTKFRPGAFRPFVELPVSALTDRRTPLAQIFGRRAERLAEQALGHTDDLAAIDVIESFLRGCGAVPDDEMRLCGRLAARIADDRQIARVDQLVGELPVTKRQLQRLFNEYVGVGPKWVIQRYRLLDAAERVASGTVVDWADLALELGYADQAHFIRDFKRLVGRSPLDYARRLHG